MDDKTKHDDPLQGNGYYVDKDALAELFMRPLSADEIEDSERLDILPAIQQEKYRKAKEEKKPE